MTDLSRQVAEARGTLKRVTVDGRGRPLEDRCYYDYPAYADNLNLAMELVPENADLTLEGNNKDGWWACIHVEDRNLSDAATGEHKKPASAICLAFLEYKKAGLRELGEYHE